MAILAAARTSDLVTRVPDGCSPTTTLATGNPKVLVGGLPVAVIGTLTEPHTRQSGNSCIPHTGTVTSGSLRVFVGGTGIARTSDTVDTIHAITGGFAKVLVG